MKAEELKEIINQLIFEYSYKCPINIMEFINQDIVVQEIQQEINNNPYLKGLQWQTTGRNEDLIIEDDREVNQKTWENYLSVALIIMSNNIKFLSPINYIVSGINYIMPADYSDTNLNCAIRESVECRIRKRIVKVISEVRDNGNTAGIANIDTLIQQVDTELRSMRCPITYQLMQTPVIAPDHRTYELNALRSWYNNGNKTCPLNPSVELTEPDSLPINYAVRDIIEEYKQKRCRPANDIDDNSISRSR